MALPFVVNNEGVGSDCLMTMYMDQANAGKEITQADVDANLTACAIVGDNMVSMASAGDKPFGKVIWVSDEKDPTTGYPVYCGVQVRGVAKFLQGLTACLVNQQIELDGNGKVSKVAADADIAAGGPLGKGQCIASDATHCWIWLG